MEENKDNATPSLEDILRKAEQGVLSANANAAAHPAETPIGEKSGNGPAVPPAAAVSPAAAAPDSTVPLQPAKSHGPIVRTYKSDVEEAIEAGHLSSISMAVSENKRLFKNGMQQGVEVQKPRLNRNMLIVSAVLILGGGLAAYIPYLVVQNQKTAPAAQQASFSPALVSPDTQEDIDLGTIKIGRLDTTLAEDVAQSAVPLGQIKQFLLTNGSSTDAQIPASSFLSLIHANVPDAIARTLEDPFEFGMYEYGGSQEFLILKVGDYDTAFSGMLSWETTLWQDFKTLFNLPDLGGQGAATASSSASSTATTTVAPAAGSFGIETPTFQDATFDNKDARVVKDANGTVVFLYSIIDNNTVVIASSVDTLRELITRLTRTNIVTQ